MNDLLTLILLVSKQISSFYSSMKYRIRYRDFSKQLNNFKVRHTFNLVLTSQKKKCLIKGKLKKNCAKYKCQAA